MYELALCAGIGGISKGLRDTGHFRTVCYVERNPYRVQVLQARIRDGSLDDAPIWDDVTTFDGKPWRGCIHILTAGFPCQPFSSAGKMLGEADERYLWPSIYRIICDIRPEFILLENVPGILVSSNGESAPISAILSDLAQAGYDAEWASITATSFGASHLRERVFVVAYPSERRRQRLLCLNVSNSVQTHYHRKGLPPDSLDSVLALIPQIEQGLGEPSVFGSNDGLSHQLERLEAVGEAVIPALAEYVGGCIVAAVQANQEVAV